MRRLLLAAALVALGAQANGNHGGGVTHTQVLTMTLDPDEGHQYDLAFNGEPLKEGWWWLLSGEVHGPGTLQASLLAEGVALGQWTYPGGTDLRDGATDPPRVQLPRTGIYQLQVTNPSDQPVQFSLFYDQTCDCTGKLLNVNGTLWFNIAAAPGDEVDLVFHVDAQPQLGRATPVTELQMRVLAMDEPTSAGELVTRTFDMQTEDAASIAMPYTADGTRYFLVTGTWQEPGNYVAVTPSWEITPADQDAPLPLLALVAIAAAAALRRR